jgi:hypothetical protein
MLAPVGLAVVLAVPDPYDVYDRARSRWASQSYPRYLSYDVRISGTTFSRVVTNTYTSFADTLSNEIHVRATSQEEAAQPYVPRGINVNAKLKITYSRHTQLSNPSADGDVHASKTMNVTQRDQFDLLGVPLLSPTYSFGLAPRPVSEPIRSQGTSGTLKTIAAVTAVGRDYDIRYAGTESIGGVSCYHLHLTPRRAPAVYRLRQLWIDSQDFLTRQALVQGNFTTGPGPALPWLVRFASVDNRMYIEDETAMAPVKYLGRAYSSVSVTFENVRAVDTPGSWALSMFRTSGDVLLLSLYVFVCI